MSYDIFIKTPSKRSIKRIIEVFKTHTILWKGWDPVEQEQKSEIRYLNIFGQVEGHMILPSQHKTTKYEQVIPYLIDLEQDPTCQGILVVLNTTGGDVEAGLAISEMLASMGKPIVSLVLGGGHSIGVPLAVSADCSFIAPSATMAVHPIRMSGVVIGVTQTFEYFDKMQERVVSFVCRNSKIEEPVFRSLLLETGEIANDVGTVLFGLDAVKVGLIDKTGGINDALAELKKRINERDKNDC